MLTCKNNSCALPQPFSILEQAERILSPRTGLVQRLYEHRLDPDDPRLFYFTAKMADTSVYNEHTCPQHNGGASLVREKARAAALGESLERYCAGIIDREALVYGSYEEIAPYRNALHPERLRRFSSKQLGSPGFKFAPFKTTTAVEWVRGYSLLKHETVYVPACAVYVPYTFRRPEECILHPTSTGLAAGACLEQALLSGLYEVVERDAFMITWHNRLAHPRLPLQEAASECLAKLLECFQSSGLSIHVVSITLDIPIPTMLAVLMREKEGTPAAAVGAAARLSPGEAAIKALEEAAHTLYWVRTMMREGKPFPFREDFSDICDLTHHPLLYGYRRMLPHLRFLVSSPQEVSLEDIPDRASGNALTDLQHCVELLAGRGLETIAVNLTSPDVAQLGLSVVRVLVPEMQPLDVEFTSRCLGVKRLFKVPPRLGFPAKGEEELNPYPHPFP